MLNTILLLMAIIAVVVGVVAARRRVSPWWLFVGACLASTPIFVVAQVEVGRPCDSPHSDAIPDWLAIACLVSSLTLFGAAAVGAVAAAASKRRVGERGAAIATAVVCPLVSGAGVLLLLYSVLAAALHCD